MKIKFLDAAMLGNKVYVKGDEAEIPDITAGELIKKKLAIDPELAAADKAKAEEEKLKAEEEAKAKAAAEEKAKETKTK